jgi:ribonuclease-3
LGDSVLGLVISESLIANEGSLSEGEMSRIRAAIVCEANLALKAREFLCLSEALVLGPSELASGGLEKVSLLADALESVIGAVFADGGWEAARAVVRRLFFGELAGDPRRYLLGDAKTMLQELAQQRFKVTPTYVVVAESGPPHQRWFEVSAQLGDQEIARGSGQSKKEAAQAAARLALDRMKEMTL